MKSVFFIVLFVATVALICCVLMMINASKQKKEVTLIPSNIFVPPANPNKMAVLNRLSLSQDVTQNENWCKAQNMDYYTYFDDVEPWPYMLELFLKNLYTHVMFVDKDMYFQNPRLSLQTILSQAGDTEFVLSRDDKNHKLVNLRAFVLQNSLWGQNKLAECYKNRVSISYVDKRAQRVLFHNVNTDYQHKSLEECKQQVDEGLPYAMSDVIVFHEHAFNSPLSAFLSTVPSVVRPRLVHPWALVPGFVHMQKNLDKLPAVKDVLDTRSIPKRIAQSMETTLTELDRYRFSAKLWQDMNPEYQYFFFDALDCKQMIQNYFPADVLKAYDILLPGAYKCDLWRLCFLYLYGGVYVDCQTMPHKPLREILKPDTLFCSAVDREDFALWQGFLCAAPRHPILRIGIEDIVDNVLNKRQLHILEFTGPHALGISRNKWLQRPERYPVEAGPPVPHEQMFSHQLKDQPFICDKLGNPILINKYFNDKTVPFSQKDFYFITHLSGKENYASAVVHNRVYKKLY
jgi:hypothetical protein